MVQLTKITVDLSVKPRDIYCWKHCTLDYNCVIVLLVFTLVLASGWKPEASL